MKQIECLRIILENTKSMKEMKCLRNNMEDLTTQNHLNIISAKWYGEQKITETNITWETQSHWKKKENNNYFRT